jgi:hypothetical protein
MKNAKSFYAGNLRNDSLNGSNNGWVVGTYMEDTSVILIRLKLRTGSTKR